MALTAAQRADVRYFTGWGSRFFQTDSALEIAMNALASDPTTEALITNPLTGSPPGLIAQCRDIDAQMAAATKRLKASKVGSIELNNSEMNQLADCGRRYTNRLCALLRIPRRVDVFSSSGAAASGDYGPMGGGNYIGK